MEANKETTKANGTAGSAPGIVIHDRFGPLPRPRIAAFIWGGKVRPVPEIPFGRRSG
jgi:hypothetical protein